jgi:hypothetical protein
MFAIEVQVFEYWDFLPKKKWILATDIADARRQADRFVRDLGFKEFAGVQLMNGSKAIHERSDSSSYEWFAY